MTDEGRLIEEAREGSKEAFAKIVRLHQVHVRAFIARYTPNWDTVEDVAQESFLSAYRALPSFRGGSTLRTWLLGIARNQALKHIRNEAARADGKSTLRSAVFDWLAETIEADSADIERREHEVSALQKCMEGLPPASASLVSEHYVQDCPAAEIARRTGKSGSAVWMALMRIRTALRHCVEARLAAPGLSHE